MLTIRAHSPSTHNNRSLHSNQLTALAAGLFDHNTVLDILYVDLSGYEAGVISGGLEEERGGKRTRRCAVARRELRQA